MEAAPGFEPAARGGQPVDSTGPDRAQLVDINQVEIGGTGQLGDTAGHLEDRSDHGPCSADVPHLPTDLPDVVLQGLRHWSQLPGHIRLAVTVLLGGQDGGTRSPE